MRQIVSRVLHRYLSATGESLLAMEFATPGALKDYLKEHPKADPANHTVKKPGEGAEEKDESKPKSEGGGHQTRKPSGKALFDEDEIKSLPANATQRTKDPDKIFEQAKEAHEQQLDWLNHGKGLDKALGGTVIRADKGDTVDYDKPGPIILIGPMKKRERTKEKVDSDYGGDWSRVGDVVRASVVLDSMDQLEDAMAELRKSGLKLARKPKDRFAKPTDAGYRDVMMNVEYPNGHVGEIQLHLKPILKAKDAGHKFYEDVRSIEAKAKEAGRDTLTADEQETVNEANRKMRDLYNDAWKKATGEGALKNASIASRVAARFRSAADTKYYDYEGLPAYMRPRMFPKVRTLSGTERVVYDLESFFRDATPLTEAEYEALKAENKPKNA